MPVPRDFPPSAWRRLAEIRARLETFLARRGYQTVATPTLEQTELFLRKSGGELAARMYSFTDPAGRRVSLRPEFTSSVVRAFVDGTFAGPMPLRVQYAGPVFRYEPAPMPSPGDGPGTAEGALEFHQLGAELFGVDGPSADAEVIALAAQGAGLLGVRGYHLRLGHMGVLNTMFDALGLSERSRVFLLSSLGALRLGGDVASAVRSRASQLGLLAARPPAPAEEMARAAVAESFAEATIRAADGAVAGQRSREEVTARYLRKLRDAEDPAAVERALDLATALAAQTGPAQDTLPKVTQAAKSFGVDTALDPLRRLLDALSRYDLKGVPVVLDLATARGIAYYTGVVFDIEHPKVIGAPSLGGGGRYDGLVKALGGAADVPALGFAYAIERIAALLPAGFDDSIPAEPQRVLVVAHAGANDGTGQGAGTTALDRAVEHAERLRAQGIPAELDLLSKTDAQAARYARARGISTILRVGRDGATTEWAP